MSVTLSLSRSTMSWMSEQAKVSRKLNSLAKLILLLSSCSCSRNSCSVTGLSRMVLQRCATSKWTHLPPCNTVQLIFPVTFTRSWLQAPPAHLPADWGGCVQPAYSSAGHSCWQTVAAESGSRCWWRTGHSGSHSACPPFAVKINHTSLSSVSLGGWRCRVVV